jgi:alpha-L-rhamnosidase
LLGASVAPGVHASAQPAGHSAAPQLLRADALSNPLGIDDATPALSWQLPASFDGAQSAYEIRAARTADRLDHPDVWDSGRVASSDSNDVAWAGPTLTSRQRVYWQVRAWDTRGAVGPWSAPAHFELGLLDRSDWTAKWIGNDQWLNRKPTPVTIDLPAQDTRYLRIITTKLGQPLVEGSSLLYRVQLAEAVVEDSAHPEVDLARGATVTSSDPKTYPGKWEPRFLVDGLLTSNQAPEGYSSAGYSSAKPTSPITLTIDLGQVRHVDRLLLYGRTDTTTADGRTPNFPADFTVTTSTDGSSWTSAADVHDQQEPPAFNLDFPPLPLFAKQFTVAKPIRSARLYASGVGIYDTTLNGDAVSKAVLRPGNTDYTQRVTYSDDDVTRLVHRGANALSVRLGSGIALVPDVPTRYTKWSGILSVPKMIAQLEITYADGTTQTIASDDTWRTTLGPTTFSHWYGGEDYDARRAQSGWDEPGADLSSWSTADVTTPPATGTQLTAQMDPPIEPVGSEQTVNITEPQPGTYVFDLGTNIAGWPVLHVAGPAGTTITLKPGERLGHDGLVDQSTMIKGGATYPPIVDHYTVAGDGLESWHPDFSYHGFRYVQVTGLPNPPTKDMISAIILRAANDRAGSFESSSDLFDSIHSLIDRSVQGNMYSILTDCPDREKLGWLEQDWLEFDTIARNYDVEAYYREELRNMAEAQEANGMVPAIAPLVYNVFGGNADQVGEPNWGSALIQDAWQMYRTYGDVETLRTYYPNMQRYLAYLQGRSSGNLLDYGLGDWGAIDTSTPTGVTATYALRQDAVAMASIAKLLGHTDDAETYTKLADAVASAYNTKYFHAADHTYANGTQADDALSLDMGVVPADQRAAVIDHLVADVKAHGNHITVGEIALPALFRVLSAAGRDDVVYDIANQVTNPSYGYSVVHGATALPEYWDGTTGYGSQDHFMMGAIEQWFDSSVGGISQSADSVGYRDLVIAPAVVGNLTSAGSTYRTVYGEASSQWRITGKTFHLDATVPGNTTATVRVPLWARGQVTAPPQATLLSRTPSAVEYRVGPGEWTFTSQLPEPVHPDTVQVALTAPEASVPVVDGEPATASFTVYNLMDSDVRVSPQASATSGFSASAPGQVSVPAHGSATVPVSITTDQSSSSGTVTLDVAGRSAAAAVEATDDVARLATMTASSTHSGWDPARTNDGDTSGQSDYSVWNAGGGWNDGTSKAWPDTLTATWSTPQTLARATVYTVDSTHNPAATYGLRDYDVQALVDGSWTTLASVRANTEGTVESRFPAVTTTGLRLVITDSNDHTYSRVVELAAYRA